MSYSFIWITVKQISTKRRSAGCKKKLQDLACCADNMQTVMQRAACELDGSLILWWIPFLKEEQIGKKPRHFHLRKQNACFRHLRKSFGMAESGVKYSGSCQKHIPHDLFSFKTAIFTPLMGIWTWNGLISWACVISCIHFGSGSQSSIYDSCSILASNVPSMYTLEAISGVEDFFKSAFHVLLGLKCIRYRQNKKCHFLHALLKVSPFCPLDRKISPRGGKMLKICTQQC